MNDERLERIRKRAHELWEQEGRPEGRHAEHWDQAAREIDAESDAGGGDAGATDSAGVDAGIGAVTDLQPGGEVPGASPAAGEGSIGTGGGSTAGRATGTTKRRTKKQ